MKLLFFLAADYANISQGNKLNVMGIFNEVNVEKFPVSHPTMFIVVRFAPELGEIGETRQLTLLLHDPDGKEIINMSLPIKVPPAEMGMHHSANAIITLNGVPFRAPGPHRFIVLLDNDQKGLIPLVVNQIKPKDESEEKPDA